MYVQCTTNDIPLLKDQIARRRLSSLIHRDHVDDRLDLGAFYFVHAIAYWGGNLWYYLHTGDDGDCPYPHPAECFEVADSSLPEGWSVATAFDNGNTYVKCLSFPEWALDDTFYERLIDEEEVALLAYRTQLRRFSIPIGALEKLPGDHI